MKFVTLPNSLPAYYRLKKARIILTTIVVVLIIYIIAAPYLPLFSLYYKQRTDVTKGFKYQSNLAQHESQGLGIDISRLQPVPHENTLVIPAIHVDARVVEGENVRALEQGIWRRPHTSTPDKGGNTVLTAHRFMYTSGPNTFYNLDKLKVGDKIALFWDQVEYTYEITTIKVVEPTQVEVEAPTEDSMLTLYTCTPLWTSRQRLVIVAKYINLNQP